MFPGHDRPSRVICIYSNSVTPSLIGKKQGGQAELFSENQENIFSEGVDRRLYHGENDIEFEIPQGEHIAAELEDEREQALKIQLRRDERSRLRPLEIEETPGQKKLKRELRREALTRLEEAVRSKQDFEEVVT